MTNPALKGESRVFLTEGGSRADHTPVYQSCWRAGGIDLSVGDVTRIECPSPDSYNEYVEVGEYQGTSERPTSNVQGRFEIDSESVMLRLTKKRCTFDIQFHFGQCTDPRIFNDFKQAVIWEDARFTNYTADELGSLASDAQGEINESSDLSAKLVYQVFPLAFALRGDDAITNPLVDVVICDNPSCGDCEEESDGCEKIYAVDDGATGSPGTSPDLIYSTDKGATFAAEDINSLGAGNAASFVLCLNDNVVVGSHADDSLHYKDKDDIGTAGGWTEITTGIVAAGSPLDGWSVGDYAFIVGDGGYVYGTDDISTGVTVLDAGVADTDNLNAVHAISEKFAVAVGENDTVIFTENGSTWKAATGNPGSGGALLCVWIVNEDYWWVGSDTGQLYYTLDQGATWTEKDLPGTLWTEVQDIQFPTKSVGFIAADKSATPRAHLLQTFNGGDTWTVLPQGATTLPLTDSLVAIATCPHDPNLVVGVGTADNGTDGALILGED